MFSRDGVLFRQVNQVFRDQYDLLMNSGLYASLASDGLLVPHEEVDLSFAASDGAYRVLRPERVPFVSYPYEWCFGQLQDAALATLDIQRRAMDHGMSLRDASAYNIQFRDGRPVLIDSLSFEPLPEGKPWVAYRQFCQHFLAPLALMAYTDARLGQLARVHIDGIPLDLAAELLPFRARLRIPLLLHVFLHARSQRRHQAAGAGWKAPKPSRAFSLQAFKGVIDSLHKAVAKLRGNPSGSPWAGYYAEAESYSSPALEHKKEVVASFLDHARPGTVWDLGANTGLFSRLAAARGAMTVSFDMDPASVEANYRQVRTNRDRGLLPLVLDLANPSPAIGWENAERQSLLARGPADMALALALVHHLAIGNNVPLDRVAEFLRRTCTWLAVEFVPKSDPKVRTLLATREDVFPEYSAEGFEKAFAGPFGVERKEPIRDSGRILYLMRGR